MALIYKAEITPSKLELVQRWIPSQRWFVGDPAGLAPHAAFRFDDPEGEVGIESLLLRTADGSTLQVPLTYRDAPLAGAEAHLVGEMEHTVLGHRWVYDGTGDPAYLAATATTALAGGVQAELVVEIDGQTVHREPTARVAGSGSQAVVVAPPAVHEVSTRHEPGLTTASAGRLHVTVARYPGTLDLPAGDASIAGTWEGQHEPLHLVAVARN